MAKICLRLEQTFYVDAIMDIGPEDTDETVKERVIKHLENNGGADTVINQGGDIAIKFRYGFPSKKEEEMLECID